MRGTSRPGGSDLAWPRAISYSCCVNHSPCVHSVTLALLLLAAAAAAPEANAAYANHPRLLFEAGDVANLRAKVQDGGDDDAAYVSVVNLAGQWLALSLDDLLFFSEGLFAITDLGLVAHLELDGIAYAVKARDTVLHLARTRDVDADEFGSSIRLRTLALGYDMAFDTATPQEQAEVRQEIRSYLDYMPGQFSYFSQAYNPYAGNHGMTVGASMGLAVVAIWDDLTPAQQDSLVPALTFADLLVDKCLTDILGADGAYKEGVLYAGWIMRMAIPY
ncbi:MAG: hypothetical protein ACE5G2_11690, partial [Candidatus Krumholzibacteriia bacterium]